MTPISDNEQKYHIDYVHLAGVYSAVLDGYDGAPDAKKSPYTMVGFGSTKEKAIADLNEQIAEFEAEDEWDKGAEAFDDGNDYLLYQCSPEFEAGYKEAYLEWAATEYKRAAENPDSDHLLEYWEAHKDEAVTGMRERLLAKVMEAPRSIVGTEKMMLLNSIGTFLLGIATASVLGLLMLAPFLMTAEEVASFWREVVR